MKTVSYLLLVLLMCLSCVSCGGTNTGRLDDISKTAREIVLEEEGFFPELVMPQSHLTLDEIWDEYKETLDEKSFITIQDIRSVCSGSNDESYNDFHQEEFYEREKYSKEFEIEPNSYWPERHLGKLEYIPLESKRVFLGEFEFESVQELVTYIFDQTYIINIVDFISETGDVIPLDYEIFPFSKNIWCINVYFYGDSSLKLHNYFEYSDKNNLYQLSDWIGGYSFTHLFDGLFDIDQNGQLDLIYNTSPIHQAKEIITFKNKERYEIKLIIDGMTKVDSFYGVRGGLAHFGTSNLGYAIYSHHQDAGHSMASYRFSGEHVLEVRGKDIYDVTYEYPSKYSHGWGHIGSLQKMQIGEHEYYFSFEDLCNLEAIGLTRETQEYFLTQKHSSEDKYKKIFDKIIQYCFENDKLFHVQYKYEFPPDVDENWFWFKLITH